MKNPQAEAQGFEGQELEGVEFSISKIQEHPPVAEVSHLRQLWLTMAGRQRTKASKNPS